MSTTVEENVVCCRGALHVLKERSLIIIHYQHLGGTHAPLVTWQLSKVQCETPPAVKDNVEYRDVLLL